MHQCLVIGAGPGGIVATKELLEKGFEDTVCLEQASGLGGVFSRSYENLTLTSSVTFSMFSDYWVGEGKNHHFWTKQEAVQYWTDYANHYGVTGRIQFNSRVAAVTQDADENWSIALENGSTYRCKHLVMAIGNNNVPRFPEWKNQLSQIPYSHSKDYINAEPFRGKNVLLVGGGESGSDVAYEISQVANKSWVSLRETTGWIVPRKRGGHAADVSTHRGIWDLPREYGRKLSPFVLKLERARQDPVFDALADLNEKVKSRNGIWGIFGTKTLALPKAIAHHGCRVVGEITEVADGGRSLGTACGEKLEDVEAVVFSTGYLNRAEFMPEGLQACDPRKMYKHVFHPDLGAKLAWIGWARPGFGSQFPIMEMQARFCALVFAGEKDLPRREAMIEAALQDEKIYMEQFEENASRIRSLVDYHRYMNDMARIIGCYPPIAKYFFLRPRIWLHLMYGPTQATQFRLRGPGKKAGLARDIMKKLPISTYNHIVKAGLRGRVYYGLRALMPRFARASA
ncbi:NAD(P)-binding domain-containing protein [Robiginitalea sp. SC105]|nr:NAD(P)-binding domain-containing protein [Robiginitalea sp. SC105]